MRQWQLQAAKARLSEVLRAAVDEGPQEITLRGEGLAVVVARAEYARLTTRKGTFVGFVKKSALAGAELGTRQKQKKRSRGARS